MREFESAQLKIDRANHHIADFDSKRIRFLATNPCKITPQYDPKTAHTGYFVEDVVEVDPRISLIIGDAIHNLRSALDHLAASLVRDAGATVSQNTYFPICGSLSKYVIESPGKIKGMSIADQNGISLLKPYLGGEDKFWGLHRMDITDKHNLVITQTQRVQAMSYRVSEAETAAIMGEGFFGASPSMEKETVSIPWTGPLLVPEKGQFLFWIAGNMEKNEDMQPSFDIAFRDVEVFKGRPVLPSLRELSDLVQTTIRAFA